MVSKKYAGNVREDNFFNISVTTVLELAALEVAASIPFELVENYQVQNEPVSVLEIIRENIERIPREFRHNSEIIMKSSGRTPREL